MHDEILAGLNPAQLQAVTTVNGPVLVLAGPGVRRRHVLDAPVSLLDIPPSLLWYLGVPVPAGYEGRILGEAFEAVEAAEAAA